jgi:hypothetical protein
LTSDVEVSLRLKLLTSAVIPPTTRGTNAKVNIRMGRDHRDRICRALSGTARGAERGVTG